MQNKTSLKTLRLAVFAILSVSVASFAQAKIVREISDQLPASLGGDLVVSTQGGNIEISSGVADEVRVVTRLVFPRADSEAEADEMMDNVELTIETNSDGVRAEAKIQNSKSSWFSWMSSNRVSVSFTIEVPEDYNVEARTSGGNIELEDLTGVVFARTSGGDVSAENIVGPMELNTSGGNIDVVEATGEVVAHTSGGDIRIREIEGPVKASTSGGNVSLQDVRGSVRATTSGGNVSARLLGPLTADALLSTSGGNVTATVQDDVGFWLDARTSGGNVKASGVRIDIDSGSQGKSKLTGEVNGGGPTLKLRTSGGNVRVNTR